MTTAPLRAAAALAVAALALTACGSTVAKDDGKSFTYWSMWKENEPQAQVLAQAVADFERDTGIDVTVQWQGRDVLKKVVPALRGGDVPDLVDQEEANIRANLVASDQFRDLTAVYDAEVPGQGRKVSDVVSAKYLPTLKKDGRTFLVPYEIIGNGLWFDGSRHTEVAVNPPKTWDDLTALFAKAKSEGRAPIALDSDISSYGAYWTVGALQGALGPGKVDELARDESGRAWDTRRCGKPWPRSRTWWTWATSSPATTARSGPPCRRSGRSGRPTSC